jgi:hypothetical protein
MKKTIILIAALGLLLALSLDAMAQRKTDIIRMYNGDQLTGEIKSLLHGTLTISTESMGTVSVEWQDIASMESKYNLEMRLIDGRRVFGSVNRPERSGQFSLSALDGDSTFEMAEVVEIRPLEEHWSDRLDVYLAAGYSYTRASGVAQTSFNTEVSYSTENAENAITARHVDTNTNEEITSSSRVSITRSVWADRSDDFRAFWGSYENNDELGLQHRYAGGGGLGRILVDNQKMRWNGVVGLQVLTEKQDFGGEDRAVEAALSSDFSMWKLNTPKLDLSFILHLYPNLTDIGRLRGNTDFRLRWEIIEDLYWDVTAYGTFDNDAASRNKWDYGITTGVGWTY